MKKIICFLLVLVMTLSLCACTPSGEGSGSAPTGLQVGYGREDITPLEPVPMGGYGNTDKRISVGYLDYLYATCVAITGTNGETVLLYTLDLISGGGATVTAGWAKAIEEKTGVPAANIQFHGTHSHSTPALGETDRPVIVNYLKMLEQKETIHNGHYWDAY